MLVARALGACIFSPSARAVDMPIDNGFVGMVDREVFDEWLRERAVAAGVKRLDATFETLTRDTDGTAIVNYRTKANGKAAAAGQARAKSVIGADGALSLVARQSIKNARRVRYVFAYHEIVRTPQTAKDPLRRHAMRHLLSERFLAGFLCMDFPARRHGERRHGQCQ